MTFYEWMSLFLLAGLLIVNLARAVADVFKIKAMKGDD
jgi:hypothetical protein